MISQSFKLLLNALHIIIFPFACFSVYNPPRSPSPVSLEPLNFDDGWKAFLYPTHSEHVEESNEQHVSTTSKPKIVSATQIPQSKPEIVKIRGKGGRKRFLTDEERVLKARERTKKWRAERIKVEPDYLAKAGRIAREKRRYKKLHGIITPEKRKRYRQAKA
ncbi:uncharacterized protein FA14DRAFT_175847 [Meira miltonrushii]|uniref:MRPL25 domain-containing protein n=1 Tax=Meira miltonrushii TaxID=1280837 RepID=A0A316VLU4_9BASI|nr:uncharacterized protein FA14DRAFT_175847 [Meira miltonrushii]PWN36535.1 hypothetical protein FA14DRAFT_175847 [Meira miltonrushii]